MVSQRHETMNWDLLFLVGFEPSRRFGWMFSALPQGEVEFNRSWVVADASGRTKQLEVGVICQ